jgi:membrane protein
MFKGITRRLWPATKSALKQWNEDDGFLLSAAMAYYAAFSLFPLILVLLAGVGLLTRVSPHLRIHQQQLIELVAKDVSPWLADQLATLLAGVQSQAGVSGPVGLVTLMVAAIGIFMQLTGTFDRIWGRPKSHTVGWITTIYTAIRERLVGFLMLLALGLMLILVFLSDLALSGIRSYVQNEFPWGPPAWRLGQTVFTVVSYWLVLGTLYKTLPRVSVPWRDALAGGLLASVIWVFGQRLLVAFVIGENYTAYGVVGSFIAVMLWVYYASAVVFFGAEFVRAIGRIPRA